MYKQIIRPLLFILDPERVHKLLASGLKSYRHACWLRTIVRRWYGEDSHPLLWRNLTFKSRVGLSAGFDKEGEMFDELSDFGFGFIEVGTVTPSFQKGNPGPRIFRLIKCDSLISRTGFNNPGLKEVHEHLKRAHQDYVLGININKNPESTGKTAVTEILSLYTTLLSDVDYFTLNLSSPDDDTFLQMLHGLQQYRNTHEQNRPVFLKLPADIQKISLDKVVDLIGEYAIDGIIATGPTMDRSNIKNMYTEQELVGIGVGGLSGKGIGDKPYRIVRYLRSQLGKDFLIIGAGGVMSPADAVRMQEAGANLVQIYSAFIYSGPSIVKEIARAI